MKRVTNKMLTDFIALVADKKPNNIQDDNASCYYSKIDGSYLTREGMEDKLKFLLKLGIVEQLQNRVNNADWTTDIGYNPKEQKWYGWSHRAIFGFGIGSTCKSGDCHYRPENKKDYIDTQTNWWADSNHLNIASIDSIQYGIHGVLTTWTYSDDTPNKSIRGKITTQFSPYPVEYGKGEWDAKTLDDAKQMAIDFANGVS